MKRFHAAVYRLVERIPRGQVATYGQIAALLGYPRAARAVGQAMKRVPPHLPWHRVVNAHGGISLRSNVGSMLTQRLLLEQEGVTVRRGRIRLREHRWAGPQRGRPLAIAALERL
jgi:methylated-DNA-protein-cysteine methyltransferase related protein